jgi:hypothetical protein
LNKRFVDPVLVALAAMFFAGIAIAGVGVEDYASNDSTPTRAPELQLPAKTLSPIVASMELAQALAVLHPSPTPTPQPLFGIACDNNDLTAVHVGSGGATAMRFEYVELVDRGANPCDLPVLSSFEALDEAGNIIVSAAADLSQCSSHELFCVSPVPLPLSPMRVPVPPSLFDRGSAGIILEHSRCDYGLATCNENSLTVTSILFHFANGLVVPVELRKPLSLYHGYLDLWRLGLE